MNGVWTMTVVSPMGTLPFKVTVEERDGRPHAVVTGQGQRIETDGIEVTPEGDGERVRLTQRITTPMRLKVTLDALVVGDTLTGTAKAGLFPKSRVEGHRIR